MNGLLIWGLALVAMAGCALFGPAERADLSSHMSALEQCQERGREASIVCHTEGGDGAECDPRAIAAYRACKQDGGL